MPGGQQQDVVTQDQQLLLIIALRCYISNVHQYTEKPEEIASWLLHSYHYMWQYYSERYNRDVQQHNLKIKSCNPQSLKHSVYTVYKLLNSMHPTRPPLLIAIATINFRYVEIGAATTEILISKLHVMYTLKVLNLVLYGNRPKAVTT